MKVACAQTGFSLVEILVATSVAVVPLVSLAHVVLIATRSVQDARLSSIATVLAQEKMEQLRTLVWGFDGEGLPRSDEGLKPSPAGAMARNTAGYCDFLDDRGRKIDGPAEIPPPGTIFVRRWSVAPWPADAESTLIVQVLVARVDGRGDVRLVAVKTRKSA